MNPLWLALLQASVVAPPVALFEQSDIIQTPAVEVFQDPAGRLTVDDVRALPANAWTPAGGDVNFGYSTSVFWARLQVVADPRDPRRWRLEVAFPPLDEVDFYQPRADGSWSVERAGDRRPLGERPINHRFFVFDLAPPAGGVHTMYLRVHTEGFVNFPVRLLSAEAMQRRDNVSHVMLGIFFGILIAMFLYNLVLFVFLHDGSYLYFVLSVLGLGFYSFTENGFAYQYLWPDWPWWAHHAPLFWLGFGLCWSVQFGRSFLLTRVHLPKGDRILVGGLVTAAVVTVVSLLGGYAIAARALSVLVFLLGSTGLVIASLILRQGFRPAAYYLVAWGLPFIGAVGAACVSFGWLPYNESVGLAAQFSVAGCLVLLSLGLADRVRILRHDKERAEVVSSIDGLTEVANRRRFDVYLALEWQRAVRTGQSLSIVMIDVDHFKAFNDTYGHLEGDKTLRAVASTISQSARRPADLVARYGGEEFAVVLPDAESKGAAVVAERLRAEIEALGIPHSSSSAASVVTASAGVATLSPGEVDSIAGLLGAADRALYQAKDAGRNRVVTFTESETRLSSGQLPADSDSA